MNSIVDYLKSVGKPSDYSNRTKMASSMGIQNYTGTSEQNKQMLNMLQNDKINTPTTVSTAPVIKPPTAEEIKAEESTHPAIIANPQKYADFTSALSASGSDITKMTDQYGQPFSQADQTEAMNKATALDSAYNTAETTKDTGDTERILQDKTQAYNDYLTKSGSDFQTEKTNQDQEAANKGVLFSGGRAQKLQNLQNTYQNESNSKLAGLTSDISKTASDYQYAYGNDNANKLSKYYTAGANSYNPNVATGGVSNYGLSTVYNPGANKFTGTVLGTRNAQTKKTAAGLLWNKGNKLMATGSSNQY